MKKSELRQIIREAIKEIKIKEIQNVQCFISMFLYWGIYPSQGCQQCNACVGNDGTCNAYDNIDECNQAHAEKKEEDLSANVGSNNIPTFAQDRDRLKQPNASARSKMTINNIDINTLKRIMRKR